MRRPGRLAGIIVAASLAAGACGSPGASTTRPPDARSVVAAITEAGLRARLEALADATGESAPHRAVGGPGYTAAADMVAGALREAGWTVTDEASTGLSFVDDGRSVLTVGGRSFDGPDVLPLAFAPSGVVDGPVVAIDWDPSGVDRTAAGCAATQYGDLPDDAIVVVRSGNCLRRDQVIAARRAGAAAFVAAYPAAPDGVAHRPTRIEPRDIEIPAVGVSREAADALVAAAAAGGTARLVTTAETRPTSTWSVLAELPGSEPEFVVMVGAHLDSVLDGPGINDDGSGVAALLELARALGGTRPRATIRLAFWSGEELGLHGSLAYASALSAAEARAIVVYVNADMIASPNGFAGVYDEPGAPIGSSVAHDLLAAAVERAGGTPVSVDLAGGSDHYGFARAGVATAGVFSGASEPVTAEQAAASGAIAGRPADACYHQACDGLDTIDLELARVLAVGLADFTVQAAGEPELLGR